MQGVDSKSTRLEFYVEFRFRNQVYQRVTDMFFEKVAKKMVKAFEQRAYHVYGGPNYDREFHRW